MVGTAGAVALLLAARRQRTTEIAHVLRDRVAEDARLDAAERRITDLYSVSVEQLGSAKAAVRLGGRYALECLVQNVPEQRRTIVNVICAYLRMPYELPDANGDADEYRSRDLQSRHPRHTDAVHQVHPNRDAPVECGDLGAARPPMIKTAGYP